MKNNMPEKNNANLPDQQFHYAELQLGPLPTPKILEGYERILPGAADRILKMAETAQSHKHTLGKDQQDKISSLLHSGQFFAFIIAILAIGFSFILLLYDKQIAGFITLFFTIATFLSVYFHKLKTGKKT